MMYVNGTKPAPCVRLCCSSTRLNALYCTLPKSTCLTPTSLLSSQRVTKHDPGGIIYTKLSIDVQRTVKECTSPLRPGSRDLRHTRRRQLSFENTKHQTSLIFHAGLKYRNTHCSTCRLLRLFPIAEMRITSDAFQGGLLQEFQIGGSFYGGVKTH